MRLRRAWWRRPDTPLSCREVGRALQAYLDGELDDDSDLVAAHLEDCLRCGLEESVYTEIKASLARGPAETDPEAIARLRRFGTELAARGPGVDDSR
ncbi:MAG: zf-HC2 domain-containing protein [Acidimicrobiales bacterium]